MTWDEEKKKKPFEFFKGLYVEDGTLKIGNPAKMLVSEAPLSDLVEELMRRGLTMAVVWEGEGSAPLFRVCGHKMAYFGLISALKRVVENEISNDMEMEDYDPSPEE